MASDDKQIRGVVSDGIITPNRVWAIVSLLRYAQDGLTRDQLDRTLMPSKGEEDLNRNTLDKNLVEARGAGLITEEDGLYRLSPDAPPSALDPDTPPAVALSDAVFHSPDDRNAAFGHAASWLLGLDPYGPDQHRTEAAIIGGMRDDQVEGLARINNDNTFGAFVGWLLGLGLAHASPFDPKAYVPDPTAHVRSRLPEVFAGSDTLPMSEVVARLARLSPVFERGRFRTAIPSSVPTDHLSKSTSLAWLRLHDEGVVEMSKPSDADVWILEDADGFRSVSHVTLTA